MGGCGCAQRDDEEGRGVQLREVREVVEKVGTAGGVDLVGWVVAVAMVAAGRVGEVDGDESAQVLGVDCTEEATGATDKGAALLVFLLARILPDEEDGWCCRGGGKGEGIVVEGDPY